MNESFRQFVMGNLETILVVLAFSVIGLGVEVRRAHARSDAIIKRLKDGGLDLFG